MVQKLFNVLNKEFSGLNQAALLLGFFALLSRVIALVRDRAFAHFLGADIELDVYYAAFKVPDLIYVSFGSLVAVTVLMPFLVDRLKAGGKAQAQEFFSQVLTVFLLLMIVVSAVAIIFFPTLAQLVAPGFSGAAADNVVLLGRIMLASPILLGLSNLFGSITQLYRRFLVFAISPVLYNIGIVIGIIWLYPALGLPGLAIGVVIGAFFHAAVQLPVVFRHAFRLRISTYINWRTMASVAKLSLPRTLGLSLNTITFVLLIAIASGLATGSISIFQLGFNLQSVPLGIIGVSYAVAAFPTLTQAFSDNNLTQFFAQLGTAARQIIFWTIPTVFLFVVLRAQIVRVILGTGEFTWTDTRLTAAVLALFVLSIPFQSLVLLFVKAYYAAGRTKRPVIVNLISTVVTVGLAYLFLHLFSIDSVRYFFESLLRITNLPGTEVIALPLAFSVGMTINIGVLWWLFRRDFAAHRHLAFLGRTFLEVLSASFFMGGATYIMLVVLGPAFDLQTLWGVFLHGFIAGVVGIAVAVTILHLYGNTELQQLRSVLRTKFWKARTFLVGPSQDELQD